MVLRRFETFPALILGSGSLHWHLPDDFKHLPECLRVGMMALAELGKLYEDYLPTEEAIASVPRPQNQENCRKSIKSHQKNIKKGVKTMKKAMKTRCSEVELSASLGTWKDLAGVARERAIGVEVSSDSRPLLSRGTGSSRPWTTTPARPGTEESTRLPSRQVEDLKPPEPIFHDVTVELELEKQSALEGG